MEPASECLPDATRLLGIVSGSWKTQAAYVAARLPMADPPHQVLSPGITEFLS